MSDVKRGAGRFMSERIKPKKARATLRRLLGQFKPHAPALVAVVFLSAVSSLAALTAPWLIGRTIDSLVTPLTAAPLLLLAGLVAVYVADALVSWFQARIMTTLSQTLVRDFRQRLFTTMTRLPLSFFDTRSQGDLMSRMSNDIDSVAVAIAQSGAQMLGSVLAVGGALLCMLLLSPVLTLAALITVPLIFLLTSVVSRQTRRYFKEQQVALGALNTQLEESINGFLEIKAFEREALVLGEFDRLNLRLRQLGFKAQLWAGLVMPLMNVISNVGFALLAGVGGYLVLNNELTIGLIASFIGYSRQFGRPLNEIANTWSQFQAAIAGAERVFEVLDETPEPADAAGAAVLKEPRGQIAFENVSFGYNPGNPVLKDIQLEVPPGATVALVGPTGSGKTTLVNLLLRFYDPTEGRILLDGRDLRHWQRASLRQGFGVVLQDTWLKEGSVSDNIRYGRPGASDAEVEEVARTVNADGFIRHLPQGYNTVLHGNGNTLSQGQRQLLAIARAALADAPLLVLDEATSNIDTRTEFHVQEAMLALRKGRTCFIIAHRLSTIRQADTIILIDQGRILECGTHEALLAENGRYAALYRASSLS